MLNEVFILTDTIPLTCFVEDNVYFSLLVDISSEGGLHKAYKIVDSSKINNISIALIINSSINKETIDEILSFFFIATYYYIDDRFFLGFICTDQILFEETKGMIIIEGEKQGIKNISVVRLSEDERIVPGTKGSANQTYSIINTSEKLISAYISAIESDDFYNNCFYLYAETVSQIEGIILKIKEAEIEIELKYPKIYKTGTKMQSYITENLLLRKRCALAEAEIGNYKTHLDLMQSHHQMTELQGYYQNEYEILPLWYKRFGHLIKVIMGKRTFKSLFNDGVKKYKD